MKKFLFAVISLLLIALVLPKSANAGPLCDSVGGDCSLLCGPSWYDNSDYDDCAWPQRCCVPTPDDCNLAGGTCISGGCPSDRDLGLSNCAPLEICCLDPGAGNGALCNSSGGTCSLLCGPSRYNDNSVNDCIGRPLVQCCLPTPIDCAAAGGRCCSSCAVTGDDIGLANCPVLQLCCLSDCASAQPCVLSVLNTPLQIGVAGSSGISFAEPNTTYFLGLAPPDCSIPASLTTDSNGVATFSINCSGSGTHSISAGSGTDSCNLSFEVFVVGGGNALCPDNASINTAIGCIPVADTNAFIGFLLSWGIGIAGGIAFLLILFAGFQITTSGGDPKKLQAGKELLTSAIAGLLLLIFSVFILRLVGVDILGLPEFGR